MCIRDRDNRAGVAGLIRKYQKKQEALEEERKRLETMRIFEHKYEDLGLVLSLIHISISFVCRKSVCIGSRTSGFIFETLYDRVSMENWARHGL